jgi:hypothetical protein
LDGYEQTLPVIGFMPIIDRETGQETVIDLRSTSQKQIDRFLKARISGQNSLFNKSGMKIIDVANNDNFIADLIRFFRRRMQY